MDTNNNTTAPTTPSSPPVDPVPVVPAAPVVVPPPSPPPPPLPVDKPTDFSQPATTSTIPPPTTAATPPPVVPPVHKKGKGMLGVIIFLVVAFICGLFIAAWYFQTQLQKVSPEKQPTPQSVVETPKTLLIGTDGTFQPMEYTASGEATLIGYDIDLGNRIGSELGATVTFKNIPWENIFTALDNKQVDMIMSSVTITEERKQKYDFSDDYLNAGQVIIVRKDNTTITSADSLQGKKIAVQEGTTNATEAVKYTPASMVVGFPDFEQATKALVDGKVDAILSDLPAAKGIITANPTLRITSDPLTNEYYGVVFRKGDPNLKKINEALSSLRTKGILTDLKQKWLD